MSRIDVTVVSDPARLLRPDTVDRSSWIMPAAIDTSLERGSPRMVITRKRSEGLSGKTPYLTSGAALLVGIAFLASPVPVLGMALCVSSVIWAFISWTAIGAGRSSETLEIDARFLTVNRGSHYMVWPTAEVAATIRVSESRTHRGLRAVLAGDSPYLPGGSLEWGEFGSPYYGSFAPMMRPENSCELVEAIRVFLADNQPERVSYLPGLDPPLTIQEQSG